MYRVVDGHAFLPSSDLGMDQVVVSWVVLLTQALS
jgi:hypothetical protein